MQRGLVRRLANVLAVVATLVVNGLANALPLNGLTTGEISDGFQVYFVPAGYVFSIWGLIYLGLIAYGTYQILPAQQDNPRLRRTDGPFLIASLANIAWLFLWHYERFALTLVAMVVLLLSLIAIYLRMGIGRDKVPLAERLCARLTFSIYLGWVSVATIANVTSVLDYVGWSGWGIPPQVWAVIMLVIGTILAWAMRLVRGDVAYDLVIVWAFVGIAIKHAAVPTVSIAAWITAALVVAAIIVGPLVRLRGPSPA
jgi:hypothetical protein